MAHSPSTDIQSSDIPTEAEVRRDRLRLTISEHVYKGRSAADIARRLAPKDKKRRKKIREMVRRMVRYDVEVRNLILARTQEAFLYNIGPITDRLNRRARALGKPDAVKLVYEASGFHNPRVKHEHGGQVEIKLTIPRPELPKAAGNAEVVEAEAIDEDA